jgi:hypothetical protein
MVLWLARAIWLAAPVINSDVESNLETKKAPIKGLFEIAVISDRRRNPSDYLHY